MEKGVAEGGTAQHARGGGDGRTLVANEKHEPAHPVARAAPAHGSPAGMGSRERRSEAGGTPESGTAPGAAASGAWGALSGRCAAMAWGPVNCAPGVLSAGCHYGPRAASGCTVHAVPSQSGPQHHPTVTQSQPPGLPMSHRCFWWGQEAPWSFAASTRPHQSSGSGVNQ